MKEIEIKLPVRSLAGVRRRLRELGFQPAGPRRFEQNVVLDTPDLSLRRQGRLLRVRSKGGRWWVTFKDRPEPGRRYKVRRELEAETPHGEQLAAILGCLGYRPCFRYEKYRAEYRRRGSDGQVLLDETPIGVFLELEGPPRWIDRVARDLGYRRSDYVLDSYGALYFAWCQQRGIRPSGMVFDEKRGLRKPRA